MIRIIIILLLLISTSVYSNDFETLLENYFGQRTPTPNSYIDVSQIQDKYELYSNSPININKANLKTLKYLPLVNDNILEELSDGKPYKSKEELADRINSIQSEEIIKHILRECLSIKTQQKSRNQLTYIARNQSLLQERKGFKDEKYVGSELGLYQKFNINYNNYELNSVIDKDAGERYINDFTSISAKYDIEDLKIIIGDYNLSFGLGNVYDQSFLSLKNTDFINTSTEYGYGAEMNRSTLENNFFRGIYGEFYISSNLRLSSFYSNYDRAATLNEETNIISSIYNSGYYRTETEIQKIRTLNEQLSGIDLEYNIGELSVGLLTTYIDYSNEINSSSNSTFFGKNGFLNSVYGAYNTDKESLKFEVGIDARNYISLRTNYLMELSDRISFLTDIRYADPDYRAPYASNFGEQSFVANEMGVLTGLIYNEKKLHLSLFADFYSTKRNTFTTKQPVRGIQLFTDLRLKVGRTDYGFRFNYERKSDSYISDIINTKLTIPHDKINTRFDINTNLGSGFKLRARTDITFKLNEFSDAEVGNLYLFELKKRDNKLNIYYGISYISFNTTSFESAIYGFQYQVPGLAYVYPFYQKGNNISMFLKYEPFEFIDIWMRFNHLYKNNNDNIGSGYEEIVGNKRTQLIFQVQYMLR